jgi:actin-related protein
MGSNMTRAGYAGEDTPRVMFPTSFGYIDVEEEVAQSTEQTNGEDTIMSEASEQQQTTTKTTRKYYIGDNKINTFKSNMEVKSPLKDGLGKNKAFLNDYGKFKDCK